MARKLRIEYEGAIHHVINRGNYRRDLFESPGAAQAFLEVFFKAAEKFDWRVHAYVLMRNHFHLAVETPTPTLGEGMHWLQSTMATRFNRLRSELTDLKTKPRKQDWKIMLANNIREKSGASIAWLATNLHLGGSATLRSYLYQSRLA